MPRPSKNAHPSPSKHGSCILQQRRMWEFVRSQLQNFARGTMEGRVRIDRKATLTVVSRRSPECLRGSANDIVSAMEVTRLSPFNMPHTNSDMLHRTHGFHVFSPLNWLDNATRQPIPSRTSNRTGCARQQLVPKCRAPADEYAWGSRVVHGRAGY